MRSSCNPGVRRKILAGVLLAMPAMSSVGQETGVIEEILVIGTTPGSGMGVEVNKIPFAVRSIGSSDLQRSQSLDLTDYLNHNTPGVNINSAQNNPLQPDLLFRGFTASPLLGLPQGVAVYQNGARINEPLGDAVNWDLLPESAVNSVDLISGSDPLFGLNTLGRPGDEHEGRLQLYR
jgi:outer membrane receptor for ferrienterochelin and colicin